MLHGRLQAAEDHLHVGVAAEVLERLHPLLVRHAAVEARERHAAAPELRLDQVQEARELREDDGLVWLAQVAVDPAHDLRAEELHHGPDLGADVGGARAARLPVAVDDLERLPALQQLRLLDRLAAERARGRPLLPQLLDGRLDAVAVEAVAAARDRVAAGAHADAAVVVLG